MDNPPERTAFGEALAQALDAAYLAKAKKEAEKEAKKETGAQKSPGGITVGNETFRSVREVEDYYEKARLVRRPILTMGVNAIDLPDDFDSVKPEPEPDEYDVKPELMRRPLPVTMIGPGVYLGPDPKAESQPNELAILIRDADDYQRRINILLRRSEQLFDEAKNLMTSLQAVRNRIVVLSVDPKTQTGPGPAQPKPGREPEKAPDMDRPLPIRRPSLGND